MAAPLLRYLATSLLRYFVAASLCLCACRLALAASLLPEPGSLAEVVGAGPAQHFTPENLYESIDGQATLFTEYGVVGMDARTYAVRPAPGTPQDASVEPPAITVRIFDMGTPLQAFGAFSQVRQRDARPAPLGAASAWARDELLITQGRFHVSVQLLGRYPAAGKEKLLLGVGKLVARRLPPPARLPAELKLLPAAGKVPRSERFVLSNALGLEFLHHAVDAEYRLKGEAAPVRLTVALLADEREARGAVEKLALADKGALAPTLGDDSLTGSQEFVGKLMLFRWKRYLVLLPKTQDRSVGVSLLQQALGALKRGV